MGDKINFTDLVVGRHSRILTTCSQHFPFFVKEEEISLYQANAINYCGRAE